MGSLDRAVRSRRLYETDHVLYREATEDLVRQFLGFFDRYPYLTVEVRPDQLRAGEQVLLHAQARDAEIPFTFYKDGIRRLRFHRGLTRQEILDFLVLLETDPRDLAQLGEDMVSLIWSKDFRFIDYAVIEEFETGAGEGASAGAGQGEPDPMVDAVQVLGSEFEMIATPVEEASAEASPEPSVTDVPQEHVESAFAADLQSWTQQFRRDIEDETLGAAVESSLDTLGELFGRDGSESTEDTAEFLRGVIQYYVRKPDYAAIGQVLRRVSETRLLGSAEALEQFFSGVRQDLRSSITSPRLLNYLNKLYTGEEDGLTRTLEFLGSPALDLIAPMYGRVSAVSTRRVLQQVLARGVAGLSSATARELLKNAGRWTGEVLEIFASGASVEVRGELEACLGHPDPTVRVHALMVVAGSPTPEGVSYLKRVIDDPEPKVRAAALRKVLEGRNVFFFGWIRDWVRGREFGNRPLWEREMAYRALGACGGDAALPILRHIVEEKPGLLQRRRHAEEQKAALLGIAEIGSAAAEGYLKLGFYNSDLEYRSACHEALGRLRALSKGA